MPPNKLTIPIKFLELFQHLVINVFSQLIKVGMLHFSLLPVIYFRNC